MNQKTYRLVYTVRPRVAELPLRDDLPRPVHQRPAVLHRRPDHWQSIHRTWLRRRNDARGRERLLLAQRTAMAHLQTGQTLYAGIDYGRVFGTNTAILAGTNSRAR